MQYIGLNTRMERPILFASCTVSASEAIRKGQLYIVGLDAVVSLTPLSRSRVALENRPRLGWIPPEKDLVGLMPSA